MSEPRIIKAFKNPLRISLPIMRMFSFFFTDKLFIKIAFFVTIKRRLNLKNPKTFNEKIQWLKLYDRKPIYTQLVDKVSAKNLIGNIIGQKHIIPTLGVWNNFDEIDFKALPDQFVLKCTHDSGTVIKCTNKKKFDKNRAKTKIKKALNTNFYWAWREWPYKNIKPRIIAEKYLVDESNTDLKDYKFFCFDGEPKALFVASERATNTKFDFFDMDFNHLPFVNGYSNSEKKIHKPKGFDKMVELSRLISKDFHHVRVDFYDINGEVYFGELTFYHWSGMVPFKPEEWDRTFGDRITLPI